MNSEARLMKGLCHNEVTGEMQIKTENSYSFKIKCTSLFLKGHNIDFLMKFWRFKY